MGTRRVALLVVAAMVVVAGCAGSDVAPESKPAEATETTPADRTTTRATTADEASAGIGTATTTQSANATLPPGVNETGVEDSEELVTAHREALNDTSFAFRFGSNVSVGPASQWTVLRGSVESGLSPLVVHSRSVRRVDGDETNATTDLWANDSAVIVQYQRDDRTELRWYNRTGRNTGAYDETWSHLPRADLRSQVTQSWLVELALTVGEYDLARTERRDGRRVAILRATEPVAAANVTDLNSTLVVDQSGRVHSLSLTAAYEGDAETQVHYEFDLSAFGEATVSRPGWVGDATPPNARNETTTIPGTVTTAQTTTGNQTAPTTTAEE